MNRLALRAALAAILAGQALASAGDSTDAFESRRRALMQRLDGGLALLAGAPETRAYSAFRQENDFYYLTGVETPGAYLLVDAAEHRSLLFLPARDRRRETWEGLRLYPSDEARRATGIEEVLEVAHLAREIERRVQRGRPVYLRRQPAELAETSRDRAAQHDAARETSPWDGRVSREKALEAGLRRQLGGKLTLADLSRPLDAMRKVKDGVEIARLREASRIGVLGIKTAMRAAAPGRTEYQLAALATFVYRWEGAAGPGYYPIVGSGPNSCTVHYSSNDRTLAAGDLVVMDSGPEYRYYQADITRTFPVSAAFSDEQRAVYRVVLEAQAAALRRVRPGATFRDLDGAARDVIERAGFGKYWLHGVSHYVGMAVHDVGDPTPFEPGVVLTVEPGIYMPEKQLGVRIEDTVLVTAEGFENLSAGAPRSVDEVESLRRPDPSAPVFPLDAIRR
jgi:Xaa-Pro aminopeptidase